MEKFIEKIETKNLTPTIDLDRPIYIQPEDLIQFRSARIILVCGMLNTQNGLSKEVVACVDFLLRNVGYQKKFIIEYFKDKKNLPIKLEKYKPSSFVETDFNVIQYKTFPWDLRFNDMFLYLYVRNLIDFKGKKHSLRIKTTNLGIAYFEELKAIFIDEVNFLELFGSSIIEQKVKKIITDVIPKTYWRENEKIMYQ